MHPDWFVANISYPRQDNTILVGNTHVHYQRWVTAGNKPGLLLVHGHAAHAHWWDFIAPALAADFDVVAIDMSGAGDSDHRENYSIASFCNELVAVAGDAGLTDTTIVAHSFGGTIARCACYLNPSNFSRLVLVDSVVSAAAGRKDRKRINTSATPRNRSYTTIEEGKRRFRLRPPQPCDNDFLLDYIAAHSLRQTDQGYVFKLDQRVFAKMIEDPTGLPDAAAMVRSLPCAVGLIYGTDSRFFPEQVVQKLPEILDERFILSIPNAGHHLFLDQPLAFIETLQALLREMPSNTATDQ